jgi:hypothetical protein
MSASAPAASKRSQWLDWKPEALISADSPESEPTEPSEPGSVGFAGTPLMKSPELRAEPVAAHVGNANSWSQWKARSLNRLFLDYGRTGEPGRITAATVRHGESRLMPAHNSQRSTVDCATTSEQPMSRAEAPAD